VISANGVWWVLRRHGLNRPSPYGRPRSSRHLKVTRPGELVGFDCFHVGRLAGTSGQCWRPSFARSLVPKLTGLTPDLAAYLGFYNDERAHTRRLTAGKTPLDALIGARKMRPR
jgi:hypothetical protein